jgi:hypothetical protein
MVHSSCAATFHEPRLQNHYHSKSRRLQESFNEPRERRKTLASGKREA